MTAPLRDLPDVVIIGEVRCGTTTLADHLKSLPGAVSFFSERERKSVCVCVCRAGGVVGMGMPSLVLPVGFYADVFAN